MGIETAAALKARRRGSAARIDRLTARADEHSQTGSVRRGRIQETARLARRKTRALSAAKASVGAIELEIGRALLRLLGHGLSRNQAFEVVGLRRHLGRRYLDLATSSAPPPPTDLPTAPSGHGATGRGRTDPDNNGDLRSVASPGRNL
jgi:hypothetical protein